MIQNIPSQFEDFDKHALVREFLDKETGMHAFIAIHRGGISRPAFGATRLAKYSTPTDGLRDALRLSKLMSYKAAMADLSYGGAKGIILDDAKKANRASILKKYVSYVNALGGAFVTGLDAGLDEDDLIVMCENSPHIVGARTDPTKFTGEGLYVAAKVSAKRLFGRPDLDRTFAIQGVGKIGLSFLKYIYPLARTITVADIDKERVRHAQLLFPKIVSVKPEDIYSVKADFFSPCALGQTINSKTVEMLRAQIVLGGANNQLADPGLGQTLFDRGIVYAPDYVVNAGGLISVAREYRCDSLDAGAVSEEVARIGKRLESIFQESERKRVPTNLIANRRAEAIFNLYA